MAQDHKKPLTIFAPAKINLYLHITGKQANGYHILDSLVCFSDIGDSIKIESHPNFIFEIDGPFSASLKKEDPNKNLVIRAANLLAQAAQKQLNAKITLTKNLPVASGVGGGSSDAAATLWGLQEWWNLARDAAYMPAIMNTLGADIPVCMICQPSIMRGIGEKLSPAPLLQEIPVLIINPMKPCITSETFMRFNGQFKQDITIPSRFDDYWSFIDFLKQQDNDLYKPALHQVPEIANILTALKLRGGCNLARMSGSGATCFGIFETEEDAIAAAKTIAQENPDWWIKSGWLNRPERY